MTDSGASLRPRQVTLAAWMIMLGSAFVVLTVFERVAGLQTLETKRAVQQFLAQPPGDGLGLGVQGVLDILRTLAMVAGGCAAAAGVLGYHVLQRSRGSRIGLSVLALPLFVSGLAAGGFMSSLVAAAALMLWLQPARDWFDGVTRRPERQPEAPARPGPKRREDVPATRGSAPERTSVPERADAPAPGAPPAYPSFGTPAAGHPAPGGVPVTGWRPPGATALPGARPAPVLVACLLTWVMSSLAIVLMAVSIAVLVSDPAQVYGTLLKQNPELAGQGVSQAVLVEATYVLGAVVIVWSLVAIALAVLVARRVAWARPVLMASAGIAGLLCLLAVAAGQLLVVLPLVACVTALALLARPDSRAWLRP